MATIDADYVTLTAIIGAAIGDTAADPDTNPDWVTATEGTVTFTPNIEAVNATNSDGKTVRVVPFPIVCAIDAQGRLTFNGDPAVTLLDLGSSKVNPSIPRDKAAYNVTFTGVKMDAATVKMSPFGINPSPEDAVAGSINLWDIAPLATGAGGAAIVRGQGLPSITTAAAGDVVAYDGTGIKWLSGPDAGLVAASQVGAAGGVASLDSGGRVPVGQVPDLSSAYVSMSTPQGSSNLLTFRAALANARAGLGALDVLTIGDSISEGTGPTTIEGRWASRLRNGLRSYCGLTGGGRGYVPAVYAVPGATQLWTPSGGASALLTGVTQGLGKRVITLTATGQKATLATPNVTRVDLFCTGGNGKGRFTYKVDGGAPVTINTAQYGTQRDYVYQITGLGGTSHTVVVEWLDTGTVYLTGAMLYNGDETVGVRLWDGAHHGFTSADFAVSTDPWWYTVDTIQPSLVLIELGTNDYGGATAAPSKVADNLATTIGLVRARCTVPPSIVLVPIYGRSIGGATPLAPWSAYVESMHAMARSDGDIAVFDLYKRLGMIDTAPANGRGVLVGDLTHPTDKGSQLIADTLLSFLTYPIPG